MPGRLEFEHEYENEAEVLIKDLEFGRVYHFGGELQPAAPPTEKAAGEKEGEGANGAGEEEKPLPDGEKEGDEPEAELDLKLAILELFNERYDKRMQAKELIFDRGLINYKTVRRIGLFSVPSADANLPTALGRGAETVQGGAGPDHANKGIRAYSDGAGSRGLGRGPALYVDFAIRRRADPDSSRSQTRSPCGNALPSCKSIDETAS